MRGLQPDAALDWRTVETGLCDPVSIDISMPAAEAPENICPGFSWFEINHLEALTARSRSLMIKPLRVSPLEADLSGLAPLFVLVGGAERLFDECSELVRKAERAGVSVELRVAKDMPHNPPALAAFHPEAAAALQDATAFISRTLCADPSERPTAARRDV